VIPTEEAGYPLYMGIDEGLKLFYGKIRTNVTEMPSPLNIEGAADLRQPIELRSHFKFELDAIVAGPAGNGSWFKYYFAGEPRGVLRHVRQYRDRKATFVYMFKAFSLNSDNARMTYSVSRAGIFNTSADAAQDGPTTVPITVFDMSNGDNFVTAEEQPVRSGSAAVSNTTGIPISQMPAARNSRELSHRYNPNSQGNGNYERERGHANSFSNNNRHNDFPLPNGARAWNESQAQENIRNSRNNGNPYHTRSVHGSPAAAFTPPVNTPDDRFNRSRSPIMNEHTSTYYREFSWEPQVPIEPVAEPNAVNVNTGGTVELFTITEPPVTFTLKDTTLKDVFEFVTRVRAFNIHYKNSKQKYPVSRAIPYETLKRLCGGTKLTTDDIALMDHNTLIRFLKYSVEPKGPRAMLAIFQSDEVLYFKKTFNYNLRTQTCRATYLKDIQTYLKDCESFFNFMTMDLNLETIRLTLPPLLAKPKSGGLAEITLAKIPGPDPDSKDNYARSIVNDATLSHYFARCYSRHAHVKDAYPEFLNILGKLMNSGIDTFHQNMEEELRYDNKLKTNMLRLSLGTFGLDEGAERSAEQDKKHNDRVERYNSRKKEIWNDGRLNHIQDGEDQAIEENDSYLPMALPVAIPIAEDPTFDTLYNVYEAGTRASSASSQYEQRARTKAFAQALAPAKRFIEQKGQEGNLNALPRICLRFLNNGKCQESCKYSHKWSDYLSFARIVQDEYRKIKDARGTGGNHPPREGPSVTLKKPVSQESKLQVMTASGNGVGYQASDTVFSDDDEDEDYTVSEDDDSEED
jgi:hypothetical protein